MQRWIPLLLIGFAFAGCIDTPEPLALSLADVPVFAAVDEPIRFTMTGTGDVASGHVGAHFWSASTDDPTGDFGDAGGCAHVAGSTSFPAEVEVACTFDAAGVVYLRGHVRSDDGQDNYWSDEYQIEVRAQQLSTDAADTMQVALGASIMFNLTLAGTPGTSNHVGGHYFLNDVEDPTASFDNQAGACAHVAGETAIPATVEVTCTFSDAGTYYVFGHLRLGSQANFWADSFQVVVA